MLKLILAEQLRLGMYVYKFERSWLDHPFWRSAFLLQEPKVLEEIQTGGVQKVWIDLSRGLDVAPQTTGAAVPPGPLNTPPAKSIQTPSKSPARPASMSQELANAKRILIKSREAVTSLFHDARLGKAVDVNGAMHLVEEVTSSVMRNPGALVSIVRLKNRDDYTYMHSVAVCALMVALARQLGLDEAQTRDAALGGLMHDLGKALMPLEVLNKPSNLTEEEFGIIKGHPEAGWKLLREGGGANAAALDIALHHHEKMDGSGYPKRLQGSDISLMSRMGAICDVYDAVTSDRPYKAGWDPGTSIRRMHSWAGHFDPTLMKAFIRSVGIYPVGSLVRLESGRLGVVIEQNDSALLSPKVTVFFSVKSNSPISRQVLDLGSRHCTDKIVSVEDKEKWSAFKYLDDIWLEQ